MEKQIQKQDSSSPKYIDDLNNQHPIEISTASNSQVFENFQGQQQQITEQINHDSESDMLENMGNSDPQCENKISIKIQNKKNQSENKIDQFEKDLQAQLQENEIQQQKDKLKKIEKILQQEKEEEQNQNMQQENQDGHDQLLEQQKQHLLSQQQHKLQQNGQILKNSCNSGLEEIQEEENENPFIVEPIFVNTDKVNRDEQNPKLYFKCMEKYPRVIRYFIAGIFGNIVLYLLDRLFLQINIFNWQNETVAWTISNLLHTPIQYILFEKLTFGERENKLKGILGVYMSYSVGTITGIFLNYMLINQFSMTNDHAWLITLIITAFVNYIMVSYFMKDPYNQVLIDQEKEKLQQINSQIQDEESQQNIIVNNNQEQQALDLDTGREINVINANSNLDKQKQLQFKYAFPSQVQRQQQKRLYYSKIWRTASAESDQ